MAESKKSLQGELWAIQAAVRGGRRWIGQAAAKLAAVGELRISGPAKENGQFRAGEALVQASGNVLDNINVDNVVTACRDLLKENEDLTKENADLRARLDAVSKGMARKYDFYRSR